jgi:hypothetical protein
MNTHADIRVIKSGDSSSPNPLQDRSVPESSANAGPLRSIPDAPRSQSKRENHQLCLVSSSATKINPKEKISL